ncbi:RND family efflux transporter MFP subunit [Kineococcus rhizosphaerae]|uniref:RND family efflux transporter MFP subunit n=1 Tax=Kineococcus rhizosphaerae TaxID=559628 RepID=A0A2T0RAE4_9ACTN|nr:RND family efflux transporter MFP subunit [Kineococcus rhizosphaerae]
MRVLSAVAAGAAVLLVAAGCSDDDATSSFATGTVARGDVQQVVDATGQVQPRASAVVKAPAAGTVATLAVSDGQVVQAGQVLMTISSPSAVQALESAKQADADAARSGSSGSSGSSAKSSAQLAAQQKKADADAQQRFDEAQAQAQAIADPAAQAAALAAVRSSRTQYQLLSSQTQALIDQVNAGLGNLDSAVASLGSAQRVQTRAAVAAAQATVDALTVVAPISGKVSLGSTGGGGGSALPAGAEALLAGSGLSGASGLSLPDTGSGSGPAGAPVIAQGAAVAQGATLVTVLDASTLSLTADVDETDVLQVQPGVGADVTIDAVDGARYRATVTGVDPTAKAGSGGTVTYTVRLSYDGGTGADGEPAATPLPGMSANVSLVVRSVQGVVEVPAAAVLRAGAQNGSPTSDTVWVVAAGKAERRPVTVGVRGDTEVEITDGLKGGETIVTGGAADVSQGQQVS